LANEKEKNEVGAPKQFGLKKKWETKLHHETEKLANLGRKRQ